MRDRRQRDLRRNRKGAVRHRKRNRSRCVAGGAALLLVAVAALPARAQELVCRLEISLNAVATCELSLGYRQGASSGLDDLDQPAPPPAPGAPLDAALVMPGIATSLPRRWLADYRPPDPDLVRNDTWELVLVSSSGDGACRLVVEQTAGPPADRLLGVSGLGPLEHHITLPGELAFDLPGPELHLRLRFPGPGSLQEIGSWGRIKALFRG